MSKEKKKTVWEVRVFDEVEQELILRVLWWGNAPADNRPADNRPPDRKERTQVLARLGLLTTEPGICAQFYSAKAEEIEVESRGGLGFAPEGFAPEGLALNAQIAVLLGKIHVLLWTGEREVAVICESLCEEYGLWEGVRCPKWLNEIVKEKLSVYLNEPNP